MKSGNKITTARFVILDGPFLSIKKSLRAGELLRANLMGLAKNILGADSIPCELSGHNLPLNNNHGHCFYLPEDPLNRGTIDSFFVYCSNGFSLESIKVLKQLKNMQNEKKEKWSLILENFGTADDFKSQSSLFQKSILWQSCSPYFHPWHRKKNFTLFDQLKKESDKRDWPELKNIDLVPYLFRGEKRFYPFSFHKFRSKKGLSQPDKNGGFWRLTFKKPVQGPIALGFGCHFGLGLFSALKAEEDQKTQAA